MLLQISSRYFVAGVELSGNKVTLAAPILKYMLRWNLTRIDNYTRSKGWSFQILTPTKIKPINNMQIEAKLVLIPDYSEEVQLSTYTHSKAGKPASPAQLFKLTKNALEEGVCIFVFVKKDGTLRKAVGTRKYDIMPAATHDPNKPYTPKGADGISTAYWDYDSNSFKSFKNDSVVALIVI